MSKGLLAESKNGMSFTEIVADNDGTIGGYFSEKVIPLMLFGWWRCPGFGSLVGWSWGSASQSGFCILQPAFCRRVRVNHEQCLGVRQAQTRPRTHRLVRE